MSMSWARGMWVEPLEERTLLALWTFFEFSESDALHPRYTGPTGLVTQPTGDLLVDYGFQHYLGDPVPDPLSAEGRVGGFNSAGGILGSYLLNNTGTPAYLA